MIIFTQSRAGRLWICLTAVLFLLPSCSVHSRNRLTVETKEDQIGAECIVVSPGESLHFEPHGLYGHINGGAELYLEFGFHCLDVNRYEIKIDSLLLEINVEQYRMVDQAAAQGIYLAKCGVEKPVPGLKARHTGNRYQLTAVRGELFLQVNNFDGDEAALPAMIKLANEVLSKQSQTEPLTLWRELDSRNRIADSEFIFRGRFSLDPIYTFGPDNIFSIEPANYGVGALFSSSAGESFIQVLVRYGNQETAQKALSHLRNNLDRYLTISDETEQGVIFKDYADQFGFFRRKGNIIQAAVKLRIKPEIATISP